MTDQEIETPVETAGPTPLDTNPSLRRAQFNLVVNVYDVNDLREGVDVMSLMFGRFGLGGFFITALDPDSGETWVVQDLDRIYSKDDWEKMARQIDDDEDAPDIGEAVNKIITAREGDISADTGTTG